MFTTTAPKTVRTLIAPDKFKGSLTAGEVADALAAGLRAGAGSTSGPGAVHCELLPLARHFGLGTLQQLCVERSYTPNSHDKCRPQVIRIRSNF